MTVTSSKIELKDRYTLDDLVRVMAKLRDPDGGCPWDLQQDFKSIAPYTIEEAYEVADAIDRGNLNDLREELGDLLLQPVYHAQMAAEGGHFNLNDVIHAITAKMINRHPHVFGDASATNASDVDHIWEARKKIENSAGTNGENPSALDGVARGLPALMRAQKLLKKAAKAGFEWNHPDQAFSKLEEEITEFREALAHGTLAEKQEEFGDVLLAMVNFGRMAGLDAEEILRCSNEKFINRFKGMEQDLNKKSKTLQQTNLQEMLHSWNNQKSK